MALRGILLLWLTLSQIYWMPFVGSTRLLSAILFGLLTLYSLSSGLPRFSKEGIFVLLLLMIFDLTGAHAAKTDAIMSRIIQYLYFFLFLSIVAKSNLNKIYLNKILKRLVNIFCLACLVMFLLDSSNPYTGNQFWLEGFNFKNNKWSITLALIFAVELGLLRLQAADSSFVNRVLSLLKLSFLFSMSLVSFGRGGLIAIISVLMLNMGIRKSLFASFCIIAIVIIIAPHVDSEFILKQLLNANDLSNYGVDELSSGRTRQYSLAIIEIAKNPFGIGWDNVPILFKRELGVVWNLHSMPLRLILESGWFISVYILTFYLAILHKIYREKERTDGVQRNVLFVGLIVALIEPNYVFGLFQVNAIFWLCFIIFTNERKIFTSFSY